MAPPTFTSNPSLFSHLGRLLVTYHLLHEIKTKLEPALAALGEIDAYCGIARLYKEHLAYKNKFCFADYLNQKTPHGTLEGFWHPFIAANDAIPNSLEIDEQHPSNIILTGPNAGGKSTIIKAFALSLILAQSIGIAPAHSCSITPFSLISTYLNVQDDIGSGNSLFKSQVNRINSIIKEIEALPPSAFAFLAIDELFNGTSKDEGENLAYSVAHYITQFPHVCAFFATHFPLLTKLEERGFCANYKVIAQKTADDKLFFPFKLEPGISEQHIAIDIIKEEGFNEHIIKAAEENA